MEDKREMEPWTDGSAYINYVKENDELRPITEIEYDIVEYCQEPKQQYNVFCERVAFNYMAYKPEETGDSPLSLFNKD